MNTFNCKTRELRVTLTSNGSEVFKGRDVAFLDDVWYMDYTLGDLNYTKLSEVDTAGFNYSFPLADIDRLLSGTKDYLNPSKDQINIELNLLDINVFDLDSFKDTSGGGGGGGDVGDLSNLDTDDKSSAVAAINEVHGEVDVINNITDLTTLLNAAVEF